MVNFVQSFERQMQVWRDARDAGFPAELGLLVDVEQLSELWLRQVARAAPVAQRDPVDRGRLAEGLGSRVGISHGGADYRQFAEWSR
jgi:hypothetical protein